MRRHAHILGAAIALLIGIMLSTSLIAVAHDLEQPLPAVNTLGPLQEGAGGGKTPQVTLELVVVGVVVLIVVGRRLLLLSSQKQGGEAPGYGAAGGAICPGCGRAFARNFLSPNLIMGKLCRCPHCGKWSIVPRATPAALAAADAAQSKRTSAETPATSEDERLRRQIEASKYE